MINLIYHPIQAATLVMEYLNENLSCHQSLEEVAYNAELGQKVRNVFSASASSKPVLVVFLDIDGVLHHNRQDGSVQKVVAQLFADVKFHYSFHYDTAATHLFDPNAVSNFEKLIQKNEGLGIVLSSNWREGKSTVQLREIFSKYAFSKYIIDKTPDRISREEAELLNPRFEWRAAQIQSWLIKHPNVEGFAILDDVDSGLSTAFGKRFIKTTKNLLTEDDIIKAHEMIREPCRKAHGPIQ